jgi:hypothetical protein
MGLTIIFTTNPLIFDDGGCSPGMSIHAMDQLILVLGFGNKIIFDGGGFVVVDLGCLSMDQLMPVLEIRIFSGAVLLC